MPNSYSFYLTRSAVRLERRWCDAPDEEWCPPDENSWGRRWWPGVPHFGGGTNGGAPGCSTAGRVVRDWSARSRNNMRWQFSGLAWEDIGARPAMVTLTYPRDWRVWAPSGPVVRRHVEAFKERWRRRWGSPMRGVWVREFQKRGAPHFHLYVGLPGAVSDAEYRALVGRTMRTRSLARHVGTFEARHRAGPPEGAFAEWLLAAWSGCVGSGDPLHARFGADVAPFFWGGALEGVLKGEVNWGRIADYLWRESGKWGQKQVPEGFASPGRSWGRWGVRVVAAEGELGEAAAMELRRVLLALRRKRGRVGRRELPRGLDGLTVYGMQKEASVRLVEWAEATALSKRRDAGSEGAGGGGSPLGRSAARPDRVPGFESAA